MAALPGSINTGVITGLFGDIQTNEAGPFTQPLTGSASFQASPNHFVDSGAKKIYVPKPFSVDLVAGGFSVTVLATDEDDFMPIDWTWKVTFTIPGLQLGPFNIRVATDSTTDITSLSTPGQASTGIVVTKGVKGDKGDPSTVPGPRGDSAYEVAVLAGFVGDRNSWLDSLKGADGASPDTSTFMQKKNNESTNLVSGTDAVGQWQITQDATSSSTWPNRLAFYYKQTTGPARLTGYFNEYGEGRFIAAKANTVALRIFSRNTPSDPEHDLVAPLLEVMDDRNTRTSLLGIYADGRIVSASNVEAANIGPLCIVIESTDTAPPPGSPGSAIVFKKRA